MAEYKCVPLTPDQSEDPRARARIISEYNAVGFDFLFAHKVQMQEVSGLFKKNVRVTDVETLLFVRDPMYDVDAVSAIDQLPNSELNGAAAAIDEAAAMIRAGIVPESPLESGAHVRKPVQQKEETAQSSGNVWKESAPYERGYELPFDADPAAPQRRSYVPPVEAVDDGDYSPQKGYGAERVRKGRRLFIAGICLACAAVIGLILTFAIHASFSRPEPEPEPAPEPEDSSEQSGEEEPDQPLETVVDGIRYTITDGQATVTGFESGTAFAHGGMLMIESSVEGAGVTSIADGAFRGLDRVMFVSIPSSVLQIDSGIFTSSSVRYVLCASGSAAQTYADQNGLETILTNDVTPYKELEYFPKAWGTDKSLYAVSPNNGTLVKSGPGDSYRQTGAAAAGTLYTKLAEDLGWSLIEFDGKYGWIRTGDLVLAQNYSGDTYTFATDYYSVALPIGWKSIAQIDDSNPKQVEFMNKKSAETGNGGHVFSIIVTQNRSEFEMLPNYAEIVNAAYGYYYIVSYPSDVQFDPQDAQASAEYCYMSECVKQICASMSVKDTGVAAMFDAHFKENPIDAACDYAMVEDPSTKGMVEAMAKYADFWKDEIDYAYELLLELKANDSAAYTTVKTGQQAWQNSYADQLEKALEGIDPDGDDVEQLNYAYTRYDFFQDKARSLYEQIYAVMPDYSYQYGGD